MTTVVEILRKYLIAVLLLIGMLTSAHADITTTVARETTEFLFKRFSREAGEIGAEALTRRVTQLASRYGDTALIALRRAGPKVAKLADDAADPGLAMRLLAQHGDEATRLVAKPSQLRLVADLGDDAATCLIRHGDSVENVLSTMGPQAAAAMKGLSSQQARRISMLCADGDLTKLGQSDQILRVIKDYGDSAVEWLWKHRKEVTTGVLLTSFLADPRPFLQAGTEVTGIVASAVIQPVANTFPWLILSLLISAVGLVAVWIWHVPRTAKSVMVRVLARVVGRLWFSK